MTANFIDLDSIEKLDRLIEASHSTPVVVFKHSLTCGISAGVLRIVSTVASDVHLIVVQQNRAVSNEIAHRIRLRHESPQAIVISAGQPIYHASHYDITPAEIESLLIGSIANAVSNGSG
ncbi:MAG: bacillithiol system redox-active protein YtxJ [Acidobacteria bacterium]|nr:bacillithiol system redox-active protein YtxJ [Acidobacteriota bacterium]MCA1608359.1 bacillithiol system redox-active protein YtxJ [Acidobacteriota bacterium]